MPDIALLDQETIDKIAAGEVIERPSSVVKELVENAIDAGASAITAEIKDGGTTLIRITDNGCGIPKDQVQTAFWRHSTSKIRSVEDLMCVSSLGFRGEALSSIAAVAQVELITKPASQLTGTRYVIEGSKEQSIEEIGAPDGTTFLVKNLFFNTPARRKFLKTPQTEGGYIVTLVEHLALSHPEISFKLIVNNQQKLATSGNGKIKDVIYQIYGREITASLLEISCQNELFELHGYLGKPEVSRGNRTFETYFINERYIRSSVIAGAIEEGYKKFLMQHQYPFCVLYFSFAGSMLDVNVHPTKMELRFSGKEAIYEKLQQAISDTLANREHIRSISLEQKKSASSARTKAEQKGTPAPEKKERPPEPFEVNRLQKIAMQIRKDSPYEPKYETRQQNRQIPSQPDTASADRKADLSEAAGKPQSQKEQEPSGQTELPRPAGQLYRPGQQESSFMQQETSAAASAAPANSTAVKAPAAGTTATYSGTAAQQTPQPEYVQEEIAFEGRFLSEAAKKKHRIIGQVFGTYWLVEFEDKLFLIDQHAAHEKVLYEKTVRTLKEKQYTTQYLSPPKILTLDSQEQEAFETLKDQLASFGFEVEPFGGKEYAICGVPGNLFGLDEKQIFLEILDGASEIIREKTPELVLEKIASMSCKAAVKGNHVLSRREAETLIDELLELENPYFCPHGRPTIISMSKYEIEKKFKRIVS